MTTIRTSNNPKMLTWAREEAGYTIEQAAEGLGISAENIEAAESGMRPLTLNQLRKAAEIYDCPFGYFYFLEPPHEKTYEPVPDYRIAPELSGVSHHRLNLEIKKVRDRREIYIDLAKNINKEINTFQILKEPNTKNIGGAIRNGLKIVDSEISVLKYDNVYTYWKSKIENDGILVYESQYIPDVSGVIGIAIYYPICPIILIRRGSSSNVRKLFTLLHEYAHLLIGKSGLSDETAQLIETSQTDKEVIETTCNRLASEILVPSEKVIISEYSTLSPEEKMEYLANKFMVTYSTAAVCLKKRNLITDAELRYLLKLRRKAYKEKQENKTGEVRIPRETLMRLDIGRPMFSVVISAYERGILDILDASKILNLRVNKIDKLVAGSI